jgi:hypothetical protein
MASTENTLEVEFSEASNNWNLEKLYIDLAAAKGKGLTPVEKKFLRGLLCGYSPSEIADQVYKSRSSSAVRVYLSNGLYKYIQELVVRQSGNIIKIKNWSRVTNLLEKAGYKKGFFNQSEESDRELYRNKKEIEINQNSSKHYDGQQAIIDVENFHGRAEEIAIVERWTIGENCRLVALLGMGGIGKTALAASTVEKIQDEFECVIWRSLRAAPSLAELLIDLIQCLSCGQETELSANVDLLASQLMKYLRSPTARCLIVLDGVEAILRSCDRAGYYAPGYECYGELFARIGEENHRGCLILTSREKPKEIASLEGEKLPVRTLALTGLKTSAGQEILSAKGLLGSPEERKALIKCYAGNPLALKMVATTIHDVFNGHIAEFLEQGTLAFGDIRDLLEQQFNRLSHIEKKLLYWLAIHHRLVPLRGLVEQVVPGICQREHLEAIESLRRRSLLDKNSTSLTLPPVLRTYITEKLSEQISSEMTSKDLAMLVSMSIANAQFKNSGISLTPGAKGTPKALSQERPKTTENYYQISNDC